MGGSSWSNSLYESRVNYRSTNNMPTFGYSHAVSTGAAPKKVHEKLSPYKVIRESRDSEAHPESRAIIVAFDVTGSMLEVPQVMQKKLPDLMGLLIRKGILAHPQIMHCGIGDAYCDAAPLQVGQFESGIEMEDDLTNIYLEGGGGGQLCESYQLMLYFAARQTSIDCWEKRGQKGYLFLMGDEKPYDIATKEELVKVLGAGAEADVPVEQLVKEVRERYHVFFLIPGEASHTDEEWLKERWVKLLGGEYVLRLEKPGDVCEAIVTAIGLIEGTLHAGSIVGTLVASGSSEETANKVAGALGPLANSAALARVGNANLPEGTGASGTARL